jgi:signal transduction histidine kinase
LREINELEQMAAKIRPGGSTAIITVAGVGLSILVTAGVQILSGQPFQMVAYFAALLIPLLLVAPLAYLVVNLLLQLEDANVDLIRKEAQIEYLKKITSQPHNSEQEQLIRDLNSFAQTVAHDLKTPLTTILGFATMLADKHAQIQPAQQKEALQTIVKTSLKMNNIVQELLLLAAVRQSTVRIGPVQMSGVITQVKQRLWGTLSENNAELIVPEPSSWPRVIGYAPWLEEVWINYISNAIKYGGTPAHVELGFDADFKKSSTGRSLARFWVRDNGKGISSGDQSQLFTQFTRLDQMRAEGHGLGLSIVARILEKLGGEVGVESILGKGSTFYFILPMVVIEPTTRARPNLKK